MAIMKRRSTQFWMAASLLTALTLTACDDGSSSTGSNASVSTTQFSASSYTAMQAAGSASLTVLRSAAAETATSAVTVAYSTADGTAMAGTDFAATSGTLQWAENDSTPKTISVPLMNSTPFSGKRSFSVALSDPSTNASVGNPGKSAVTITGNGSVAVGDLQFSDTAYTVGQSAGTVMISVSRDSGSTGPISVAYAVMNGTAIAGTDFTAGSGTLQWADGDSTAKSFSIAISNAAPFSGTKAFTVTLSDATGGAMIGESASSTVTISGDATPPVGSLQLAKSSYTISQSSGSVAIAVNRTGGSNGAISASYTTSNGTAIAGTDYTASSGVLQWADGSTASQSISVPVSNSSPYSTSKSFTVALSDPSKGATIVSPGSASVTIAGDAAPPVGSLELSAASYTIAQSGSSLTITVSRVDGSYGAIGATYATANGSAISGTDYTSSTGTLSWSSGDSASKAFSVPISNATPFSGNKSFTVALSSPQGGTSLSSPSSAIASITGDAVVAVGSLQLDATSFSTAQGGGSLNVTVNRTGGSDGAVSVAYGTTSGTAIAGTDYTASSGVLQWAAGDATSKSFSVSISNATPFAGSRSFTVGLSSPSGGAALGAPASAVVSITGSSSVASGPSFVLYQNGVINAAWNIDLSWGSGAPMENYLDRTYVQSGHSYDMRFDNASSGGWQPAGTDFGGHTAYGVGPFGTNISAYTYMTLDLWTSEPADQFDMLWHYLGDATGGTADLNASAYIDQITEFTGGKLVGSQWNYKIKIPFAALGQLGNPASYKFYLRDNNSASAGVPWFTDNVEFTPGVYSWIHDGGAATTFNATKNGYNTDPSTPLNGWADATPSGSTTNYAYSPANFTSLSAPTGVTGLTNPGSSINPANVMLLSTTSAKGMWKATNAAGFSLASYDHFTVALYPTKTPYSYQIQFYDTSGKPVGTALNPSSFTNHDWGANAGYWTVYCIPLSAFGTLPAAIGAVSITDSSGAQVNKIGISGPGFYK